MTHAGASLRRPSTTLSGCEGDNPATIGRLLIVTDTSGAGRAEGRAGDTSDESGVNYGSNSEPLTSEDHRQATYEDHDGCACYTVVGVCAAAMMRPTFSAAKNSGIDVVPARIPMKRSVSAWLPRSEANSCCISADGGSSIAS